MLLGEVERVPVAVGEEAVGGLVAAVDGAQDMDHVAVREAMPAGEDGLAGADRPERNGLLGQPRPGGAVERPSHAAARPQFGVRRVDDGLHVRLAGDVAGDEFEGYAVSFYTHRSTGLVAESVVLHGTQPRAFPAQGSNRRAPDRDGTPTTPFPDMPHPISPSFREGDALLLVDVQNDFLPGGALAVPEGDAVIPVLNRWIDEAEQAGLPIVATRDWHPSDHVSFEVQGGPWPPHCVAGTEGAAFHPDLALPEDAVVVSKATTPDDEAYSGFDGTDLAAMLRALDVRRVWIGGLATDYCVRATALDAAEAGFEVTLIPDGHRGITPDTSEEAVREMAAAGVTS